MTSIVAAICVIFFLLSGEEEVIVYSDGIRFADRSLTKILDRTAYFPFSDIIAIEIEGRFSTGDELYVAPISGSGIPPNKLILKLKDGSTRLFISTIYIDKLKRVVEEPLKRISDQSKH